MIKEGQLQSPSIKYCYLFLDLLNIELPYYWIIPLVSAYFCFQIAQQLLVLISIPKWKGTLQIKSLLGTQYKDPQTGLESRTIDLECTTLPLGH